MTKKSKISIVVLIIVFIALISLPFLLQANKTIYVNQVTIGESEITSTLSYTGTFDSQNTQSISFTEQFFVTEVNVKNGQKVKKDDVILKGYSLSMTGARGQEREIKAEIDGIISLLNANKNSLVQMGAPCVMIKDYNAPKIVLNINPQDHDKIKVGQKADFVLNNHAFTGMVSYVSSNVESKASQQGVVSSMLCEITLENKQGRPTYGDEKITEKTPTLSSLFVQGYEVDVVITVDSKASAVTVPISAVKSDNQGDYCFISDELNNVVRKQLLLGMSSDDKYEVLKGLAKGDRVIVNPPAKLKEGDVVVTKN